MRRAKRATTFAAAGLQRRQPIHLADGGRAMTAEGRAARRRAFVRKLPDGVWIDEHGFHFEVEEPTEGWRYNDPLEQKLLARDIDRLLDEARRQRWFLEHQDEIDLLKRQRRNALFRDRGGRPPVPRTEDRIPSAAQRQPQFDRIPDGPPTASPRDTLDLIPQAEPRSRITIVPYRARM